MLIIYLFLAIILERLPLHIVSIVSNGQALSEYWLPVPTLRKLHQEAVIASCSSFSSTRDSSSRPAHIWYIEVFVNT